MGIVPVLKGQSDKDFEEHVQPYADTIPYYSLTLFGLSENDTGALTSAAAETFAREWITDPANYESVRITFQWSINHFNPRKQFDPHEVKNTFTLYEMVASKIWSAATSGLGLRNFLETLTSLRTSARR